MNYEGRTMNHKILVADDSPTVRNVTESLLRKHGYRVLFADDGAKALRIAKTEKPDLIFLDDSLSVVNGVQVCKELKQNKSLKDVPVVMLLSRDEADKAQELKQIGVDVFLTKPFNPKEILDHVGKLLEKEKTLPSDDEQKPTGDPPPEKDNASDEKNTQETAPSIQKEKSEDVLDVVETSDLMEDFDSSAPASEGEMAHGFSWFLSELRKESQKDGKEGSPLEEQKTLLERKTPDQEIDHKKKSKIYEIDEHQKGYEDFLNEIKQEVEESDKEKSTPAQPSATAENTRSGFDQLFSDLKEKISRRIAQEVAKKISPEFLEKIIREEMAKLGKESS